MISIIGGSGFIGTRLSRRLVLSGDSTYLIIDKKISNMFPEKSKIADVRSVEALRAAVAEESVIINLAAEHWDDVRPITLYTDVNVGGANNICTVAREKKVNTIIFTSTVAVYGFAPVGTDESGTIAPFNEYGRSKYEAEAVYKAWQVEAPDSRTLVIVRPTVAFGERNRGNVYNLLQQIVSRKFVMVGDGKNRKSMAYVENLAAFLEFAVAFKPGVHIYNYVDKPDFSMNGLVSTVNRLVGRSEKIDLRLPYALGYCIGKCFDVLAFITRRKFTVSSIRVRKFCADSVFETAIHETGFVAPVSLSDALAKTVRYEFIESHENEDIFFSE